MVIAMKITDSAFNLFNKESFMETKHNVNKNMQGLETQVIELGTATKLTLGWGGSAWEGRTRWLPRDGMTDSPETQVTELGAATELTLGFSGKIIEGKSNKQTKKKFIHVN